MWRWWTEELSGRRKRKWVHNEAEPADIQVSPPEKITLLALVYEFERFIIFFLFCYTTFIIIINIIMFMYFMAFNWLGENFHFEPAIQWFTINVAVCGSVLREPAVCMRSALKWSVKHGRIHEYIWDENFEPNGTLKLKNIYVWSLRVLY